MAWEGSSLLRVFNMISGFAYHVSVVFLWDTSSRHIKIGLTNIDFL